MADKLETLLANKAVIKWVEAVRESATEDPLFLNYLEGFLKGYRTPPKSKNRREPEETEEE